MAADDDFEEFERMMEGSDFIDVANPYARDAVEYAHSQRRRMLSREQSDHRQAQQPDFPFPERDNPMLAYLLSQAESICEERELKEALLWLAVHAWFEGALRALDERGQRRDTDNAAAAPISEQIDGGGRSDDMDVYGVEFTVQIDRAALMASSIESDTLEELIARQVVSHPESEDDEFNGRLDQGLWDIVEALGEDHDIPLSAWTIGTHESWRDPADPDR